VALSGGKERNLAIGNRVAGAAWAEGRAAEPRAARSPGVPRHARCGVAAQARGATLRRGRLRRVGACSASAAGGLEVVDLLAIPAGARMLDAGCGYGIIGLVAARLGAAPVDMVDVNIFAVAAAEENIRRNGVANAHAFPSDGVPEGAARRYDVVATNPPFHV